LTRHSAIVWDPRRFAGLLCGGGCEEVGFTSVIFNMRRSGQHLQVFFPCAVHALPPRPAPPWRMRARAALSSRSSPSLLVAFYFLHYLFRPSPNSVIKGALCPACISCAGWTGCRLGIYLQCDSPWSIRPSSSRKQMHRCTYLAISRKFGKFYFCESPETW